MRAGPDFLAMRARRGRITRGSLALALVAMSGCTIVQMQGDLRARQSRIDAKQEQLQSLRATNAALAAESDRLRNDLQRRELDANELHARLDQLIRLNEAAQTSSVEERTEQQQRRRQLQAVNQQAEELGRDTGMTPDEKQQKLAALREKTRELLTILLAG